MYRLHVIVESVYSDYIYIQPSKRMRLKSSIKTMSVNGCKFVYFTLRDVPSLIAQKPSVIVLQNPRCWEFTTGDAKRMTLSCKLGYSKL